MRIPIIVCAAFLAGSCAGPPGEQPVERAEASPPEGIASMFHGSWSLVSWTDTNEDGETFSPYGDDPFGRIVYAPSGNMAVVLMGQGREIDSEIGSRGGAFGELNPDEMRTVLTRFFAYSGSFTVDEEAGTVTHHIEAALAPNWVGGDRVRKFEMVNDDRIVLRPEEGTSQLTWQRESRED
ncbi:MAG TPA: lipocalin-like domain-containing protein [Vicinamibacteria bacterium]|nr:lipocalin-like domain-containing protein [Vicinamibacteria bacterium]